MGASKNGATSNLKKSRQQGARTWFSQQAKRIAETVDKPVFFDYVTATFSNNRKK
jgi:hypothetical protein